MRETIENSDNIIVTPHAALKASDMFNVDYGEKARQAVRSRLKRATYVSEIVGESGKVDRLYAYRRIAFVMDRYDDVVITLYMRENVDADLRDKVRDLLFDHLSELKAKEQLKETELLRLRIEYEMLTELNKIGLKEATAWLTATRREIEDKEREVHRFQLDKSKVAKGVVAYL